MSTFYVKNSQINDGKIEITGEDYRHLKNVLRYKIEDDLEVCDENETRYQTKIVQFSENCAICEIQNIISGTTESPMNVTLYQGLPKSDKLEQIIQKTTEMGVCEIIPVAMERSIVKIDEKNVAKKLERWNKIALEASKQSGRQKVPTVQEPIKFKNIIENILKYDIVLLLYENEKSVTIKEAIKRENHKLGENIAILIGPEGGFSLEEVEILSKYKNVQVVTVGPRILRTETAGLAALAMIVYELEL